jgi:hypothetical protein
MHCNCAWNNILARAAGYIFKIVMHLFDYDINGCNAKFASCVKIVYSVNEIVDLHP